MPKSAFDIEGRKRISLQLDMAPLIDVVFLLLIFFMLTNTMMVQEAITVNLPVSDSASTADKSPIVITISDKGDVAVNEKNIEISALSELLKKELSSDSSRNILLKTDSSTPVQSMIEVMDIVRNSGGQNLSIATKSQ